MVQTHPVHQAGNPAYADPVLRTSSPATSESSQGHDETTPYEQALSADEFSKQIEAEIGLHQISNKEKQANESPFIKHPPVYYDPMTTEAEREEIEKKMHAVVMDNLRKMVSKVEEEQRFKQTMKRGIKQFSVAPSFPDTVELNSLLDSMMVSKKQVKDASNSKQVEDPFSFGSPRAFGR